MSTITETLLSGSTDGKAIKVVATATPGTLIHTAHASAKDELWLWAFNSDSVARLLTIEFGGTTDPDNLIEITIQPQKGLELVVPGLWLTNSLAVRAFAAAANVITVSGLVYRIS